MKIAAYQCFRRHFAHIEMARAECNVLVTYIRAVAKWECIAEHNDDCVRALSSEAGGDVCAVVLIWDFI